MPVAGLLYFVFFFLALVLVNFATTGTIPDFVVFSVPFLIVSAVLAFGIWRQARVAYAASAIFTGFLLAFEYVANWEHGIGAFANPAGTVEFLFVVTSLPGFIGAFLYSILGFRELRAKLTGAPTVPRTIPRSGSVALVLVGFIIGGLVVGLFAGATQARLLNSSGTQADITVALGAASSTNGQFYLPPSFTVAAGSTVTWVNKDTTAHTVTSTTGAFDSGSLASGETYKFTFQQPGTYQYTCSFHSWMKGTIVVTSG